MKKALSFILITIMCILPLTACSTDLSDTVEGTMDSLYESIKNMAEPFFKQDDKYNSNANSGSNTNTNSSTNTNIAPSVPTGTSIGEKLPGFELQVFDETGLLDEYIDPTKTGKVTVINFWGIWCHFCLEELPDFSEVATEYKDSVTIVAIHSTDSFNRGAVDYVRTDYQDSDIIFASDVNLDGNYNDDCYEAFGGASYYPFTIIIDENGVITYSDFGAISKATLTNEIEKALGN